jgi:SAM-dependent methyltransferase
MENLDYKSFIDSIESPDLSSILSVHAYYAQIFKDCKNVVDLGCGKGYFLTELKKVGVPDVTGVEIDNSCYEFVRANGLNCIRDDIFHYLNSGKAGSCDGLNAAHIAEHLPPEKVDELIRHAHRMLSPDGILVIRTPNVRSIRVHLTAFWLDPTHIRFYQSEYLDFLLKQSGFEVAHYPVISDDVLEQQEKLSFRKRIMKPFQVFIRRQIGLPYFLAPWYEPMEICITGRKLK